MIKIEAIINPLKYDNVKCSLNSAGIKRIKVSDIIGVRESNKFAVPEYETNHPFDLISMIKIEIFIDEEHPVNLVSAILQSAGTAQISIERIMIPTLEEKVRISINKLLENNANYSNN